MPTNIVELIADQDDCAFDQRCKFGHRVEGHAVYCHNDAWQDGPRKCRRTWYTGGEVKDEDCPGFDQNPEFKGDIKPTPVFGSVCSGCHGAKLVKRDPLREHLSTCDLCQGIGVEPEPVALTKVEVLILESLVSINLTRPWDYSHPIIVGKQCRIKELPDRPNDEGWTDWNSAQHDGGVCVYMTRITQKGFAILKAHWAASKK